MFLTTGASPEYVAALWDANLVLTGLFTVEVVLKMVSRQGRCMEVVHALYGGCSGGEAGLRGAR